MLPIWQAIDLDLDHVVAAHLAQGLDRHLTNAEGYSMLHVACKQGCLRVVTRLLRNQTVSPFQRRALPRKGQTHPKSVDDDSRQNRWIYEYPLHTAVYEGHNQIVEMLFHDIQRRLENKPTDVTKSNRSATEGTENIKKKWEVYTDFCHFWPITHAALRANRVDTLMLLLSLGAPMTAPPPKNPLVVNWGRIFVTERILEWVDREDLFCTLMLMGYLSPHKGDRPLRFNLTSDRLIPVLDGHFNLSTSKSHGSSDQLSDVTHFFVPSGRSQVYPKILNKMVEWMSVTIATLVLETEDHQEMLEQWAECYAWRIVKTKNHKTELLAFWLRSFPELKVKLLRDAGRNSMLYYTVSQGNEESTKLLVQQHGCSLVSPLSSDPKLRTNIALHLSASCNHLHMLKFLKSNGVDLRRSLPSVGSALDCARVGHASLELLCYLMREGVQLTNHGSFRTPESLPNLLLYHPLSYTAHCCSVEGKQRERFRFLNTLLETQSPYMMFRLLQHSYQQSKTPDQSLVERLLPLSPDERKYIQGYLAFFLGQMLRLAFLGQARVRPSGWIFDVSPAAPVIRRVHLLPQNLQRQVILPKLLTTTVNDRAKHFSRYALAD